MKVRIFDEAHELDLESTINKFLKEVDGEVIDIKYQVSIGVFSEEQIYCFSAMIIYNEKIWQNKKIMLKYWLLKKKGEKYEIKL